MSTLKNPSKTVINNIEVFFEKEMSPTEFAQSMRKFMHGAIMLYMQNSDDSSFKNYVEDGYYNLTQFLEEIDPVLHTVEKEVVQNHN